MLLCSKLGSSGRRPIRRMQATGSDSATSAYTPSMRACCGLAAARAEAALAASGRSELRHLDRHRVRDRGQHQLGDPIAGGDGEGFGAVGVEEEHSDLAPEAGVDQPWCVDE